MFIVALAHEIINFLIINCSKQEAGATSEITSDAAGGPQLVIWGTDVVVGHCKDKFRR